jgi:enoyl-CoA hydratase/carnithine racemase
VTQPRELVTYRLEAVGNGADSQAAYLTLDDPGRRNALSDALLDQLIAHLERAATDARVRVIVLTSSHSRVFSSGGNLDAFADDRATIAKYQGLARFPAVFRTLTGIDKPVVCAANGDVLAGALGIALACDLVIAKESIRLGCPEINVGAFPFMISALIFRATGRLIANELMNSTTPCAGGSPISQASHRYYSAWASGHWRRPGIFRSIRRWTTSKPNSPWRSPLTISLKACWLSRRSVPRSGATRDDRDYPPFE